MYRIPFSIVGLEVLQFRIVKPYLLVAMWIDYTNEGVASTWGATVYGLDFKAGLAIS